MGLRRAELVTLVEGEEPATKRLGDLAMRTLAEHLAQARQGYWARLS